ncbi:helix-turn-helix domain-containing protein [Vallitalea okinawensis]|uniref:helix-turn-helix domain-containing protein n=1 Tax=Vallitalea okinawensis TaxID=2078660 RepID=UPI000CFBADCD|nr:helix-turn-helix domain-containing protein [Vallitalea okinawensis]
MKRFFKTSFSRFLITHLTIFVIPCFLILFYFYPKIDSILMDRLYDDDLAMLKRVQNNMDFQIDNIHQLPVAISLNSLLSENHLRYSSFNRLQSKGEIGKYINTNAFIDNTFIYMKDFDYLIQKKGTTPVSGFGEIFMKYEHYTQKELLTLLESVDSPFVIGSQQVTNTDGTQIEDLITLVFPLNKFTKSTLMVTVKTRVFMDLIITSSNQLHSEILVVDDRNQVIAQTDNFNADLRSNLIASMDQLTTMKNIDFNDTEFVLSYCESPKYKWKYISVTPYEMVGRDINKIKLHMILLLFLLIVVEILAIYIFSAFNYRPLKALLGSLDITPENNHKMNEYNMIRSKIDNLAQQNQLLNTKISHAIPATVDYLVHSLINNRITTLEEFNQRGQKFNLTLHGIYFNCTLIKINNASKENLSLDTFMDDIKHTMSDQFTGHFASGFTRNSLLLISGRQEKESLKDFLQQVINNFNFKDAELYIGVSQDFENVIHMNKAYVQASSVVDYLIMRDQPGILNYQELPYYSNTPCYPSNLIYNFKLALLQNNKGRSDRLFSQLMERIQNTATSVTTIRTLTYDLTHIMNEVSPSEDHATFTITPETGIKAIHQHLLQQYDEVSSHLVEEEHEQVNHDEISINLVLSYINEHYYEYDMSLQRVADEFNMSSSSLSRFFKKHTDVTFKNYLNVLRINKAQQLLEQTDMSINAISSQLGYSGASSFIRVFKSQLDMSPGQYRKDKTMR